MAVKGSRARRNTGLVCRVIGIIVLILVIVLCLPMVVPRLMGNDVYTVVTGSMEPTIPVGSLILVKPVEPASLEPEEIIAFASEGSVVSHRVVENHKIEGEILTKGDANAVIDAMPVPYSRVIGKVTNHIPVIGDYMQVFASFIGKIYLMGVALIGVLFIILGGVLRG